MDGGAGYTIVEYLINTWICRDMYYVQEDESWNLVQYRHCVPKWLFVCRVVQCECVNYNEREKMALT